MPTTGSARSGSLDGIRALAVLGVLAYHAHYAAARGGYLGVDVFFVLSGYLITRLLLQGPHPERPLATYGAFLLRRLVRLTPALAVALVAVVALGLTTGRDSDRTVLRSCTAAAAGYVMDLPAAERLQCNAMWHITWSLAVEQQFYLVWPWVLAGLLASAGRSARLCLLLYAGAVLDQVVLRAHGGATTARLLYAPYGGGLVLLLGCALALHLHGPRARTRPATNGRGAVGAAGVLLVLFVVGGASTHLIGLLPLVLTGLATTTLIASLVGCPPTAWAVRAFGATWLAYLGRISYSLYLWHEVAYRLAELVAPRYSPVAELLRFSLALGFAAASYAFVELPATAWWRRRELSRQPTEPSRPVSASAG